MYAGEPRANIKPLNQLPEAGHQNNNNALVGVAPGEGGQAVIVVDVDPETPPPQGSCAILEKEGRCQKFQIVY